MSNFSPKDSDEVISLGFNFSALLSSGETISTAVFEVRLLKGTDASPSSMLSGAATISGAQATQKITGGVLGCTYRISCTITTSGTFTYIESADLEIEEKE